MVIFLNGINVTPHIAPILASFSQEHNITVRDLAAYLVFNRLISASDIASLALRTSKLQLTIVDHDLDEFTFDGGSALVVLD